MDIKDIAKALKLKMQDPDDGRFDIGEFTEALIAELAKQNEPVVTLKSDDFGWGIWEDNLEHKPAGSILNLYTIPPTAEQIANETAEACALTYLEDYDLTDIAERVRAGEWRKFVKEVRK